MKQLPHQRFTHWFSQKSRRTRIGLICAVVLVTLSLCVCSAMASTATDNQQMTHAAPTTTAVQRIVSVVRVTTVQPTSVPTQHPTVEPTQTIVTATYGTPLLGGPISDFIGKYGTPNDHTDAQSYHWFRDSTSYTDGLIVWELYHPQVDSIEVAAVNGDIWTATVAEDTCTVYNPSDAKQLKRIPLVNSSAQPSGFDVVYLSNTLAQEFTPDDFTDANGNNVQRGSFDIQYLYTGDGSQNIESCSIILGQEQTTG